MKERTKGIFTGLLIAVLALSMAGGVFAATQKQATLSYNDIKIELNGKLIEPKDANGNAVEPFIIDGTTYLPVRAVAGAVGLEVGWDQATSTVKLTGGSSGTPSTPTQPTPSGYGRTNPAPVGAMQEIKVSTYTEEYTAQMTLNEVIRGANAWEKIKAANPFNSEAPEGKEYILATFTVKVVESKDDKSVDFSPYNFDLFSSENVEYDDFSITIEPTPAFSGDVYEGGTMSGYAAFIVDKSDSAPKAVYGRNYDGTGGIWFSLK